MKIHIAHSAAELDACRPLWDTLHRQNRTATLFQSFAWNRLAAEVFGGREQPCVAVAEHQSGAAIIPASRTRDGLTLLGDALFDYRDVLWTGDENVLHAAWAELADFRLPISVTAVRGHAHRHWAALAPSPFVNAPQVRRADVSADNFERRHPRIGRTLRRLARQGVSLHRYCGSSTRLVRSIYDRKATQMAGSEHNVFADPTRIDFMVAACAMAPDACDIFTFEAGAQLVAALVTFRDGGTRRFYTVWFEASWAQLSPGTSLCFEVTRRSLAEGLDCDYMTGEQPHKARFMTASVPLYRVNASAEMVARAAGTPLRTQLAA